MQAGQAQRSQHKVDADPLGSRLINRLPHDARRRASALVNRRRFRRFQELRHTETPEGYSLAQFDELKCIFVHVPKVAGVSICRSLFGNLAGGHLTIALYRIVFSKDEFDGYFKFAFVRNPWDRLLSAYTFLAQGGMNRSDRAWAEENLTRYGDFEEFVSRWVSRDTVETSLHFLPQHRFLCLPFSRTVAVNFVGSYENLDRDFAYVRERLGLSSGVGLPHHNKTPAPAARSDYRDHYTAATRRIVEDVYREDIELFGYSF